jgi:hypothetical protein
MKRLSLLFTLCTSGSVLAQQQPEFNSGLSLQAHWTSGMATSFRSGTENYSGMLLLNPQATMIKGVLRAGTVTGLSYTAQKARWIAGPQLSVKLFTLGAGAMGTAGNLQLNMYYLWTSGQSARVGASLLLETGKRFFTGPWVNIASQEKTWWFHWGLGWRWGRNKKVTEPFNR